MNISSLILIVTLVFVQNTYADQILTLCIDGHCKTNQKVSINNDDWSKVKDLFTASKISSAQELSLISQAIALIEQYAHKSLASLSIDKISADDLHDRMDNRDQYFNYKTYMTLLQDKSLLQHFLIRKSQHRSTWTGNDEYALIISNQSNGKLYVLDAINTDFEASPDIMLLKTWKNKYSFKRLADRAFHQKGKTTKFKHHAQ